eukprot:TRINITY_DN3884_c0_g1_i5.p2 TRINITY_DN3884_c0_g1~~TRINITY_DN3884_c0_g1_i5.p2  ORF type:complete len:112 (+),score=7.49 TRINITY_DN3884_c0_g1_i5:356-691(+)
MASRTRSSNSEKKWQTGLQAPGRDGYCTITPNVTSVYVPVTRYVYKNAGKANNRRVVGGTAIRAGSSSGNPSMQTHHHHRRCNNMYNVRCIPTLGTSWCSGVQDEFVEIQR